MREQPNFDPSDLFYQLLDLSQLMKAAADILYEMEYVRADGSRNTDLDRLASLQRIAVRNVDQICDAAQVFDNSTWVSISTIAKPDPILIAINQFHDGCERFNAARDTVTQENEEEIVRATYGPPQDRLTDWSQPALTLEGAIAALKFMDEQKVFVDQTGEGMRKAVLGFLEALS